MRWWVIALALWVAATAAIAQVAQIPDWPPRFNITAAGYSGPFEASGSVTWRYWAGLRAFSSAKRGTKFANLCQPAGSNCIDVVSDATTGKPPNAPTVNGSACNNSGHVCTVHTLYDQTGGGQDFTQATAANQPTWVTSCSGLGANLPCLSGNAASIGLAGTASASDSEPYMFVGAALANSLSCCSRIVTSYNGSTGGLIHFNSNVNLFCGSDVAISSGTATGTWYAVQGLCNGASSKGYVNGTNSGTVSAGSSAANTSIGEMEDGSGGSGLNGDFVEGGMIPSDNSGAFSTVNTNIRNFWGF